MCVPIFFGVLISESFFRYRESKYCPQFAKSPLEPFVSKLKKTHCAQIACTTIFTLLVSNTILKGLTKALKGRATKLHSLLKKTSHVLENHSLSIPFLVVSVCYFSRREALYALAMVLYQIYAKTEEIAAYFVNAALDPHEIIEKLSKELNEELSNFFKTLKVISNEPSPQILQDIDENLERLSQYLEKKSIIIPQYQEKLLRAEALFQQKEAELASLLERLKCEAEKIQQLISEVESTGNGFLAKTFKQLLGFQGFIERKKDFDQKIEIFQDLHIKIMLITSGIHLLEIVDKQEVTVFCQWNIAVRQAPLKRLEGMLLFL